MGKYILRPNDFTGERLIRLDFLEQVGLLHHIAPIGGICHVFKPDQNGFATLIESNLCLRIFTEHEVRLPVIGLTQVGKEIATILPPVDSKPVLKRIAVALPSDQIKSMDICRILNEERDYVRISDPIEVLRSGNGD